MNKMRLLDGSLRIYTVLIFAFIFAPILFSVIFSFNSQRFPTIPLGEFSTEWYVKILNDPDILQAAIQTTATGSGLRGRTLR
jgi:spermidine/putrescine transport system permease protein